MYPTSDRAAPRDDTRIRVLLVEKNEAFLHAAMIFLQRQSDFVVLGVVRETADVIRQVQALKPQIVLFGLDGLGIRTLARLREALPGTKIVALTLDEDDAYQQAIIATGADTLICKAKLITDLLPAIRWVMQSDHPR